MSAGLTHGSVTIPAAGAQPKQLTTPATAQGIILYAPSTNSDPVYPGSSTVTSSNTIPLAAGSYLGIDVGDAGSIYLAGTENDTVRWLSTGRTLPP